MQTGQIRPGIATNDCSPCRLLMPPQATSTLPSCRSAYTRTASGLHMPSVCPRLKKEPHPAYISHEPSSQAPVISIDALPLLTAVFSSA